MSLVYCHLYASIVLLICTSLWIKASAKWLNVKSVWRHLAAADLGDDGALGSGVGHRGSRAGAGHVRVASPAVRRHRRPGASAAQDLHHQRRLGGGHHQPAGVSGSDPLSAERQDGSWGGEADDPRAQVIQFNFSCIALFTMQIVAKQLYRKL